MTREQIMQRVRGSIPDFLRKAKPVPVIDEPVEEEARREREVDWAHLFELAGQGASREKGA